MTQQLPIPNILNHKAVGEKLTELARIGVDRIDAKIKTGELPDIRDPQIFAQWLGAPEMVEAFPAAIQRLRFVQADDNELVVNLPGQAALEQALANPGSYYLPLFYANLYECDQRPLSEQEQSDLILQRIADYSMNQCR